jgi:hypothetical protein
LKIGTLSFERCGDEMKLSGPQHREYIASLANTYQPDVVVCAGWSLEDETELRQLVDDVRIRDGKSKLIVEVKGPEPKPEERTNRVYLVTPGNNVRSLGPQVLVESGQVAKEGYRRLRLFEELIPEKSGILNGSKLFVLCCGEINIIKRIRPYSAAVAEALLGADIIVNHTHDLMSRPTLLHQKREWLSQRRGERDRVCISVSNWNTCRKQKQSPQKETLHTVYVSGQRLENLRPPEGVRSPDYVYRECEIPL